MRALGDQAVTRWHKECVARKIKMHQDKEQCRFFSGEGDHKSQEIE